MHHSTNIISEFSSPILKELYFFFAYQVHMIVRIWYYIINDMHGSYVQDVVNNMSQSRINSLRPRDAYRTIIREVSLHVKRERVRGTSHLGAQFRYTSRSRTLLGFASRRDVSTEKKGHRYQQMTQQSIKRARKQNLMHSAQWCFGTW